MSLLGDGYEIVTLSSGASTAAVAYAIKELRRMLGCDLSGYRGDDLELHAKAQAMAGRIVQTIVVHEIKLFKEILGGDIHVQRQPFLRISRPGIADDNIGYHRDTWYGDTPYEVSVWIPFTDTDEGNALRVVPGSHVWSEEEHPVERFDGSVEKGSVKHSLGFIHGRPKRLVGAPDTVALTVKVGQMIVFPLSLLHGVEVNRSTKTRVSMDVRLANSLAPIRWQRSRDENYYEELCTSPVTKAARLYYAAQKSTTAS